MMIEDEMKEWEEASLTDLRDDIYWGEPKQQEGVPVMVDPKTGKFFYEEPEPEIECKNEW
jgi:hypothetical protein